VRGIDREALRALLDDEVAVAPFSPIAMRSSKRPEI
jgi:hypothetical protein